jgi:K+ transporter
MYRHMYTDGRSGLYRRLQIHSDLQEAYRRELIAEAVQAEVMFHIAPIYLDDKRQQVEVNVMHNVEGNVMEKNCYVFVTVRNS